MAVQKFTKAAVTIGGSGGPPYTGGTLLPHIHSVTLNRSADMLDISEMGVDTRINLSGLMEWSVEVELVQDFADNNVDELLDARMGTAAFGIQVVPDSSVSVGASNPEYYGLCVLESVNPLDGTVGDAIMVTATFQSAGSLTRRIA